MAIICCTRSNRHLNQDLEKSSPIVKKTYSHRARYSRGKSRNLFEPGFGTVYLIL